jgi:hypothetical protein
MSDTTTESVTYSVADVENVVRNFAADLRMIAESSNTWSREMVENYISDITYFAKNKYLLYVDVTLLNGLHVELKAARYTVNESSGELTASRPGGVMWPRTPGATLRIVVGKNSKWDSEPPDAGRLNISWVLTSVDITHQSLHATSERNFTSNAYGLQRKDYGS